MLSVEFQVGNTHYQFAESDSKDCDTGLFDSARHSADPGSRVIDAHGRGSVSIFDFQSRSYVLRHYRRGGIVRHITLHRFLWLGLERSRPWREFALLQLMQDLQLPCPQPYACQAEQSGLTSSGSLITQLIPNALTLAENLCQRELIAAQWFDIGRVIRRFHDANIFHADLNAHNILIDDNAQIYLIDFDKGAQRSHSRTWKFANLKRLQRSIMKCWMQADTFYFSPASWDDLRDGYVAESSTAESAVR